MLSLPRQGLSPTALDGVREVVGRDELQAARREVDETAISDEVAGYVVDLVRRTRELPSVSLGASPRAAVHLLVAAKAAARLAGRDVRHARRCRRDRAGRARPPADPDARGGARAVRRRGRDSRRDRRRPRPALMPLLAAAPTIRTAAIIAAIALVALLVPVWAAVAAVIALLAAAGARRVVGARAACRGPRARGGAVARRGDADRSHARPRATGAGCCCASPAIPALELDRETGVEHFDGSLVAAPARAPRASRRRERERRAARPGARESSARRRAGGRVYPDLVTAHALIRRLRRELRQPPGQVRARAARPRHRLRVDPRVHARRRHPPAELAGDRADGTADEQSVPGGARPRCRLPARQRQADGGADRLADDARRVAGRGDDARAGADELGDRCGAIAFDESIRRVVAPAHLSGRQRDRVAVRPRAGSGRLRLRARVPARRAVPAGAGGRVHRPRRRGGRALADRCDPDARSPACRARRERRGPGARAGCARALRRRVLEAASGLVGARRARGASRRGGDAHPRPGRRSSRRPRGELADRCLRAYLDAQGPRADCDPASPPAPSTDRTGTRRPRAPRRAAARAG